MELFEREMDLYQGRSLTS